MMHNPEIGPRVGLSGIPGMRGVSYLKSAIDGPLCVGVFHPNLLEDQVDVVRH